MEMPNNNLMTRSLYKRRNEWEALVYTFVFFRENWKQIIIPLIIFVWPVRVLMTYLILRKSDSTLADIPIYLGASGINPFFTYCYIISIYIGLLSMFSNTILVVYIHQIEELKEKVSLMELFFEYGDNVMNIIGAIIAAMVIICLGLIFFVIPGIYLAVVFSISIPVMIIQKGSILNCIEISYKLLKDKFFANIEILGCSLYCHIGIRHLT